MKLFKKILVYQAPDQSPSASLRIAARLARQMQSQVTVVGVRQQEPRWWQNVFEDEPPNEPIEIGRQEENLNRLIDEADFDNDVRAKILQGRPIDVLVHEAIEESHDLILKDADSQAEGLFFGSLDLRLLRLAPSAVWLSGPNSLPRTRRILAAIDPSDRTEAKQMNERLIRIASLLARQDSSELFLVSAWHTPPASFEHHGDGYKRFIKAKAHVRQKAWESVEHVINTSLVQIPPERVLFQEGVPSDTVATAVGDLQPDLMVMGSVAKRGIPGLFIGNTAEEITRQVECPILAIKPDDFTFLLPVASRRRPG